MLASLVISSEASYVSHFLDHVKMAIIPSIANANLVWTLIAHYAAIPESV